MGHPKPAEIRDQRTEDRSGDAKDAGLIGIAIGPAAVSVRGVRPIDHGCNDRSDNRSHIGARIPVSVGVPITVRIAAVGVAVPAVMIGIAAVGVAVPSVMIAVAPGTVAGVEGDPGFGTCGSQGGEGECSDSEEEELA